MISVIPALFKLVILASFSLLASERLFFDVIVINFNFLVTLPSIIQGGFLTLHVHVIVLLGTKFEKNCEVYNLIINNSKEISF